MRIIKTGSLAMAVLLLQACSGGDNNSSITTPKQATQNDAPAAEATTATDSGFSSARVFIVSPADGETLTSPVTVVFGIENFRVAPAGTFEAGTGHHHLLIDTDLPPLNQPIPADANHMHFGKAQTEATIELAPGPHKLQLVLGDGYHVPHDPALISAPITITVTESATAVE
jgi:hypothetical protein